MFHLMDKIEPETSRMEEYKTVLTWQSSDSLCMSCMRNFEILMFPEHFLYLFSHITTHRYNTSRCSRKSLQTESGRFKDRGVEACNKCCCKKNQSKSPVTETEGNNNRVTNRIVLTTVLNHLIVHPVFPL